MARLDEYDEFLLNRLLDGDLSNAEAATLEERLASEPELRAMLDAMTRVDNLLAERRSDQPDVDWTRFHAQVMDQVSSESLPSDRVLRFPTWLRVAVPIAVAASIALVITLRQQPKDMSQSPAPSMRVAYRMPALSAAGKLVVEYNRQPPRVDRDRMGRQSIQISYVQSDELQETIEKYDKARVNRPLWHLYTVHTDQPEQAEDDFLGMSAM